MTRTFVLPIDQPFTIAQYFNTAWVFDKSRTHKAIDYMRPIGSSVFPCYQGKVHRRGFDKAYGNYIEIDHGQGIYKGQSVIIRSLYAHFLEAVTISSDAPVDINTVIGKTGSTGLSTAPHVHFELRVYFNNGTWAKIDPQQYKFITREEWKASLNKPLSNNKLSMKKIPENLRVIWIKRQGEDTAEVYVIKTNKKQPFETRHRVKTSELALVLSLFNGKVERIETEIKKRVDGLTQGDDFNINNLALTHPELF